MATINAHELATLIATRSAERVYKELLEKYTKRFTEQPLELAEEAELSFRETVNVTVSMHYVMRDGRLVPQPPKA